MADIWSEKNVGFIGPIKFRSDLTVGPTDFAKSVCAWFGAVIIVGFYIDDFIFALFIFMKEGKVVNYNGSEIISCKSTLK